MSRPFPAKVYQTPLLKAKTFGDGKGREERLVRRARDREQVYCLGFLPLGNRDATASPERALSS